MTIFHGDASNRLPLTGCIWTNGCYDILHVGHIRLFEKCRSLAREHRCPFVIGIDSDTRVKSMKGSSRPINSEAIRAEILLSMRDVDRVVVYDTAEELKNILHDLSPEAIVIGEEYRTKTVIGGEYAKQIVFFPKVEGMSTTNLLNQKD